MYDATCAFAAPILAPPIRMVATAATNIFVVTNDAYPLSWFAVSDVLAAAATHGIGAGLFNAFR